MLDPNYDHALGGLKTASKEVTFEPTSVTQLPLSDSTDNTQEFYRSLDEWVPSGVVTSEEEKLIVDRYITRRQQLFGYSLNNGVFGKRSPNEMTQMLSKDPDYIVFDTMYDFSTENMDWMCLDCKKTFNYTSVDLFEPTCDECDAPLVRNHNTREVVNPRAKGGVGNAYVKASDSIISSMQLRRNLCDKWVFREIKSQINYETIFGDKAKVIGAEGRTNTAALDNEHVKIIKVNALTMEQTENNKAYIKEVDDVAAKREAHLEEHPNTSASELAMLFPTPKGTLYQIKAAGSLSKMG